jgi:hypothetical protein
LILPIQPPQSFAEYRVSVRCSGRIRQFRKQARMTTQSPPIHSFNAIKSGGWVWIGKIPFTQCAAQRFKISKRQSEQPSDNWGCNIAACWNAPGAGHGAGR